MGRAGRLLAVLGCCCWGAEGAALPAGTLAECKAVAALFSNTCDTAPDSPAPNVTSIKPATVTCSGVGMCAGDDTGSSCVWHRRLCVTCSEAGGEVRIRVQSNGLPDHCYTSPKIAPVALDVDWSAVFAPGVDPEVAASAATAPTTQDQVNDLLCDIGSLKDSPAGQSRVPSASGFTRHGTTATNTVGGVAINGVMLFNQMSVEYVDPFYPANWSSAARTVSSFTDAPEKVDKCLGHPQAKGVYHYHMLPPCLYSTAMAAEGNQPLGSDDAKTRALQGYTAGDGQKVIGVAKDGNVIFGPYAADGSKIATGWDVCNGKELTWSSIPGNGTHYSYIATDTFPYFAGCFGPGSRPGQLVPQCTTNAVASYSSPPSASPAAPSAPPSAAPERVGAPSGAPTTQPSGGAAAPTGSPATPTGAPSQAPAGGSTPSAAPTAAPRPPPPTTQSPTTKQLELAWVLCPAAVPCGGKSCDSICADHYNGVCKEGHWPKVQAEFEVVAAQTNAQCGGISRAPSSNAPRISTSTKECLWVGAADQSCGQHPSDSSVRRMCPCAPDPSRPTSTSGGSSSGGTTSGQPGGNSSQGGSSGDGGWTIVFFYPTGNCPDSHPYSMNEHTQCCTEVCFHDYRCGQPGCNVPCQSSSGRCWDGTPSQSSSGGYTSGGGYSSGGTYSSGYTTRGYYDDDYLSPADEARSNWWVSLLGSQWRPSAPETHTPPPPPRTALCCYALCGAAICWWQQQRRRQQAQMHAVTVIQGPAPGWDPNAPPGAYQAAYHAYPQQGVPVGMPVMGAPVGAPMGAGTEMAQFGGCAPGPPPPWSGGGAGPAAYPPAGRGAPGAEPGRGTV
eukprot:TRINITY_DN2953_c0_g2_i4.p1 TRINITY_DN2953_c0_g2~~TRINITY_DN2953_c0_g2_i4.p1  ORF type:complete len:861 (+),score=167.19 TRINITY_DN2953_c0_g2_i4:69-2585(+)